MTPAGRSSTKPDYGIDAPGVVRNLFLIASAGVVLFLGARFGWWPGVVAHVDLAQSSLWAGIGCGLMGCWMLYDSKVGKVRERERLLDLVPFQGTENVLDLGCGRGLLLVAAARRLRTGKATGLDLWQAEDLTGNQMESTLENARREGVLDRVEVRTGDMRSIPFPDRSFDVVVSNVAIHNIYDRKGRETTMGEIARVLKPGGYVVIHDIRHTHEYASALAGHGLVDVRQAGSRVAQVLLLLLTFGSLRPSIVTARGLRT